MPKVMSWVAMFCRYRFCVGVRPRRSARRVLRMIASSGACSSSLSPASMSWM
ncbi:hypothetical protein D3C72_2212170 [compost metagenome]